MSSNLVSTQSKTVDISYKKLEIQIDNQKLAGNQILVALKKSKYVFAFTK